MNDELNENEILLIDKLKEIGEDEDSIFGISILPFRKNRFSVQQRLMACPMKLNSRRITCKYEE